MNLRFGVKIYDNDWFLRHGLKPEQAADLLSAWGVTYVIAQSKYLPMSDSAVNSAVSEADRKSYEALDDVAFRNLLRDRKIGYFACLNICFDPLFSATHPELAAIDQHGRVARKEDWYIGIAPDRAENLSHKINLLRRAVTALTPDAIHLGFIRWPGFWETWLPSDQRSDKPEFCFAEQTISAFNRDTGSSIPVGAPEFAFRTIQEKHRAAWTRWKCRKTVAAIAQIRRELADVQVGLEYSINTLPFFKTDFDNAVEEVFGQDIDALSEVVDVFEVMAYHQILARPPQWPAQIATDIRRRSRDRRVICTLQARALYLDGMHAGRGRSTEITAHEFGQALDALAASEVEGICVFTFTDLLEMQGSAKGREMLDSLARFRR